MSSNPYPFASPYSQKSQPVQYARQQHFSPLSSSSTLPSPSEKHPYYAQPADSSSSTSLLSPSSKTPAFQAALAKGPSQLRNMASTGSLNQSSPYSVSASAGRSPAPSSANSISDKFSLSPDPSSWGANISPSHPEADDYIHNPDPRRDRKNDRGGNVFTYRGLTNLGCLILLGAGLVTLFAGYPLITFFTKHNISNLGGFNLGGTNASGQVPSMVGNWGLIDLDTPQEAYTKASFQDGSELQLVFSDEFNTDGRTFYPGDDPYWEAVDLHYWETNNLEWYDPSALITRNGSLEITLSHVENHGLDYMGGLMSTWNKFCFTGGLIETNVMLPGINNVIGLWPAVWTMGNLGRAGYGASLDGMWPYGYDACDVGTLPNQTLKGLPVAATVNGDTSHGGVLSFLPGQRLSRCTCSGESHPGPMHADGTFVGRAAPEIDIFEAQVTPDGGEVSQSAQWGPFNAAYSWFNTSANLVITDQTITQLNSYTGGVYQQATSGTSLTNQDCYQLKTGCFSVYGFEYQPGFDQGYITWINNGKAAWTLRAPGMAADTTVEISARPVPQEPMYIIANLGMSTNFGEVDLVHLTFPAIMRVDWIRVYQPKNAINIGCDPADFPTATYINEYIEAYTNPNLTTWVNDYKQPLPKNKLLQQC